MRSNYPEILENAEMELEYLEDYVSDLSSIEDTRKLRRAWSGVLSHYVQAVSALIGATNYGPSKGWSDRLCNEQKNDPILYYAFRLRNQEVHVFEEKRASSPRAVTLGNLFSMSGGSIIMGDSSFTGPDGVTRLLDGWMKIEDGRYARGNIPKEYVQEREHYIVIKPISPSTRGGKIDVPNPQTPPEKQAKEIAQYVSDWVKVKLVEAKELAAAEKRK